MYSAAPAGKKGKTFIMSKKKKKIWKKWEEKFECKKKKIAEQKEIWWKKEKCKGKDKCEKTNVEKKRKMWKNVKKVGKKKNVKKGKC